VRETTDEFAAEAGKRIGAVYCRFLSAEFGPAAGVLRLWDGPGTKRWNGVDFLSGLSLIDIKPGDEDASGATHPLNFSLTWRDQSTQKDLIAEVKKARPNGKVWMAEGFISPYGDLIRDPIYAWVGRAGPPVVQEGAREGPSAGAITISVTCEQFIADQDRALRFRMTPASQLEFDESDKGLMYQPGLSIAKKDWGVLFYNEVHPA
jgi:hypothetical protein